MKYLRSVRIQIMNVIKNKRMKKIMFSDAFCLTLAVLNGSKTMTRRVLRDNVPLGNWEETQKHLPYKVGDIVAIAQSYKEVYPNADFEMIGDKFMTESAGWTNKMFVRADLMPHHIRITDIKMERLRDISEEDCLKEGIVFIESLSIIGEDAYFFAVKRKVRQMYDNILKFFSSPQRAYVDLIDKISGRGTWKRNPWVVVYTFERVD
nr:MAG TPA: ASCH domain protein [Caudoviricetes sp.]